MRRRLSIRELLDRFPQFRVAVVIAERVAPPVRSGQELDALLGEHERACRERWRGLELSQIPEVTQ